MGLRGGDVGWRPSHGRFVLRGGDGALPRGERHPWGWAVVPTGAVEGKRQAQPRRAGSPCTPQSRQQPWCPFPRGGSPRSGVRAQLCSRSVRRCRGRARGAAAQLSSARGFGGPGPPGIPLRPPGRLPGPGLLLPSGLSRILPSPSPCPWAGRCFTYLLDGLCADVAARGVCGGSRNLFLSGISPSCSRGGTGGCRTCCQSPPVLCLPRFLARSGRAVGWQGTATIFRAVLQWRGVPWLGRQSPPRPGIALPEAPARGEPACPVVCERGCGGAVVGL